MSLHDSLGQLQRRISTPSRNLAEPGPTTVQLDQLLTIAMRVPDHGKLTPWRFLLIADTARTRLSGAIVARKRTLEPEISAEALEKERMRFLFAPCIVAVIASPIKPHKIPECEQIASAAAVCMQLLNAADAMGFGAQWLTGWAAYDPEILAELGLSSSESLTGFIHVGTRSEPPNERVRPRLAEKIQRFASL